MRPLALVFWVVRGRTFTMARIWQLRLGLLVVLGALLTACPGAKDAAKDAKGAKDAGAGEEAQPASGGVTEEGPPDAGAGEVDGSMEKDPDKSPAETPDMAPGGFAFPGIEASAAAFESCDLTAVDWEALLGPEVEECFEGDEAEEPQCQYYNPYPDQTVYTDLNSDGLEEAWFVSSTDVYGIGAAVTYNHLELYTRDADCKVSHYSLRDEIFDLIQVTALTEGVKVTIEDLDEQMVTVYVYEQGGLRVATDADWTRDDGAALILGELTGLTSCTWDGLDWLAGIGARWASLDNAMPCDNWDATESDYCYDLGAAGSLSVDLLDVTQDGAIEAVVTATRYTREGDPETSLWLLAVNDACEVTRYPLTAQAWSSMGLGITDAGFAVSILADAVPVEVREYAFEDARLWQTRSYWEIDSLWSVDGLMTCNLREVDWDALAAMNQATVRSVLYTDLAESGREGAWLVTRVNGVAGGVTDGVTFYAADDTCQVFETSLTSGPAGDVSLAEVEGGVDVSVVSESSAEPTGYTKRYRWLGDRLVQLE